MSSFFKGSCIICWITWLICCSYLIGVDQFTTYHVVSDENMKFNYFLLYTSGYMNIAFAFLGCVFLKCDINHIFCAVLYIIPVGVVIPGLTIWGAVNTSRKTAPTPNPKEMLDIARSYYLKNNEFPLWFLYSQSEFKCCGINGPEDFREIYRSFPTSKCVEQKEDVPCSCCTANANLSTTGTPTNYPYCRSAAGNPGNDHCLDENKSKEWMMHVVHTSSKENSSMTIQEKCDSKDREQFQVYPHIDGENVYSSGCYKGFKAAYESFKYSLQIFFILSTICPLLMLLVYMQNAFKTGKGEKGSVHSLDVETPSMLGLPAVDASEVAKQPNEPANTKVNVSIATPSPPTIEKSPSDGHAIPEPEKV